jgi:hypothetical protein
VSGDFAVYQKPHFGRASAFAFEHISLQKKRRQRLLATFRMPQRNLAQN